MRHTISLFILFLGLLALSSCTDNLVESVNGHAPKGTPIDAYLNLTVGDLDIDVATRATADEIEDTEAERRVNDIWVFEYDASTGSLLNKPEYIKITEQSELVDIPVASLVDNNSKAVIIYVVANMGNDSWANETDFGTSSALKAHTIQSAAPIRIDGTDGETEATLSIPMGGSVGDDGSLTITQNSKILVPVKRMFAKLYVHVALSNDAEDYETPISTSLTRFYMEKIPSQGTVATTYNEDGSWYSPQGTRFDVSRSFTATEGEKDDEKNVTVYGPFVLYVPENMQGTTLTSNALKLTTDIEAQYEETGAQISYSPTYVAYPGSWDATLTDQEYGTGDDFNFNIQRNNIYDIQINITVREDDLITPSANCIIAPPGVTTAFYPYVRDEEPSTEMLAEDNWESVLKERYSFTTYLDPSDETKVIRGLKIIWQSEGCIGDNSGYNLVWMDDVPDDGLSDDAKLIVERRRKIYVNPAKIGNALIAAYNNENCTGDILWSWHIWATDLPIEEDAIEYYHYSWDESGINTNSYVAGPLMMNCNLGALAEKPTTTGSINFDTYGMLYQWGRKDPIPPMKSKNIITATEKGGARQTFYDYADNSRIEVNTNRNRVYSVEIAIYDNANKQIVLTGYDGSMETKSSTGLFYTDAASNAGGKLGGTDNEVIMQSVKHPTMFIAAWDKAFPTNTSSSDDVGGAATITNYYNGGDWLPVNDDFLWGGGHPGGFEYQVYNQESVVAYLEDDYGPNKQIFDPCPYGWRVSSGEIWLGLTIDGKNWTHSTKADDYWERINCAEPNFTTVTSQNGYTFYMQGWKTGKTSFFPTQGSRIHTGQPYLLGSVCGNYHNATVDKEMSVSSWGGKSIRRVDILHIHAGAYDSTDGGAAAIKPFTDELYYYNKAVAGPLRCVRDTK